VWFVCGLRSFVQLAGGNRADEGGAKLPVLPGARNRVVNLVRRSELLGTVVAWFEMGKLDKTEMRLELPPDSNRSRRRFIGLVGAAVGLGGLLEATTLLAQESHVSESDPLARSLGYTDDASKVDKAKYSTYKAGEQCSKCRFFTGSEGKPYGPCQIFSGKLVNANGWCSSFNAKT
jgi:hypothetical protein